MQYLYDYEEHYINRIEMMNIRITKEKIAIWVLALIAIGFSSFPR